MATLMKRVLILLAAGGGVCLQAAELPSRIPNDPFAWVYYTRLAKSDLREESDGTVSAQEVEAVASLPVLESRPLLLAIGAGFTWDQIDLNGPEADREDLYAVSLPLDLFLEGDSPWSGWANATPLVAGDYDGADGQEFRTLFHAMALYRFTPSVQAAAGLGYSTVFGEERLYPLGGLIWRIGPAWELSLLLPQPRVTWAPNERLLVFTDLRPAGNVWRLQGEDTDRAYDFNVETWRAGAGCEFGITRQLWLHLAAGIDFDRHYETHGTGAHDFKSDADDAFFFRVGLILRPPATAHP